MSLPACWVCLSRALRYKYIQATTTPVVVRSCVRHPHGLKMKGQIRQSSMHTYMPFPSIFSWLSISFTQTARSLSRSLLVTYSCCCCCCCLFFLSQKYYTTHAASLSSLYRPTDRNARIDFVPDLSCSSAGPGSTNARCAVAKQGKTAACTAPPLLLLHSVTSGVATQFNQPLAHFNHPLAPHALYKNVGAAQGPTPTLCSLPV